MPDDRNCHPALTYYGDCKLIEFLEVAYLLLFHREGRWYCHFILEFLNKLAAELEEANIIVGDDSWFHSLLHTAEASSDTEQTLLSSPSE